MNAVNEIAIFDDRNSHIHIIKIISKYFLLVKIVLMMLLPTVKEYTE